MENACDPGGQSGDTYLAPIHFYQATATHLKRCIIIETMVEASIYGKVKCFRGRVVFYTCCLSCAALHSMAKYSCIYRYVITEELPYLGTKAKSYWVK